MKNFHKIIEENDLKIKVLYGQDLAQKNRRLITFIDLASTKSMVKQTYAPPLIGMVIGGIVGMIGGGPKGAAVGGGVGFFISGTYAGYSTHKAYKKWLKQYRNDELLPEFLDLFNMHPDLQQFKCPLTTELMHYPLTDPWGHSYEKNAIEVWVNKHKTSPITKRPLVASELRPDYTRMGQLAKIYHEILEKEVLEVKLTQIQQEGINTLLRDLKDQMDLCFYAENKLLIKMLKSGEITRKVYAGQLSIIAHLLDQ